jgi:hypothetical protein
MKYEEFKALKPEMVELLRTASYHYADDTGKEWGAAGRAMDDFVNKAVEHELSYYHLDDIYREADPLVPFSAIIDALLRKAYNN